MQHPDLRQLQQSFFAHLLKQPSNIAESIQSTPDRSAEDRLSIYATGYRLRLKEALSTDFNALYSYMGDELFEQLMDTYIDRYPSHHTSLRHYSQHMLELIATQAPFSNYAELYEIAAIELAFNHSFDAADCQPLTIDVLTQIAPEDWSQLTIQFHPSLQVLHLSKNSIPIWQALSEEQAPPDSFNEDFTWVIWRKGLVSRYKCIENNEAKMLELAFNGNNFEQICNEMRVFYDAEQAPMQVIAFLQSWISEQWVCLLK